MKNSSKSIERYIREDQKELMCSGIIRMFLNLDEDESNVIVFKDFERHSGKFTPIANFTNNFFPI